MATMKEQRFVGTMCSSVLVLTVLVIPAAGQATLCVSLDSSGGPSNFDSARPAISADGRYVAFESLGWNLVPGDTNQTWDIFVRDRLLGTTERVSVDSAGVQGNNLSKAPAISADGRFVAFRSYATNLVPGDTNQAYDIFVRDRLLGTTERVSVDSSGAQANSASDLCSISADGRYVAFGSNANNLVPNDTNSVFDIFVRDRLLGMTERVSVSSAGVQANSLSVSPLISADGRYVAFLSDASNVVPNDTTFFTKLVVRDRQLGTTELVTINAHSSYTSDGTVWGSISADARFVAFLSGAPLVAGDTNDKSDIFVRDRQLGPTELNSVDSNGVQTNDDSLNAPSLSADGRYVAFLSYASNLVPGDTNGVLDCFVRDRQLGTTERVDVGSTGVQTNAGGYLITVSISADGRYVTFDNEATNLVTGDTNGAPDIFVRDRLEDSNFTSLCDPSMGGVIACPCSNPPSASGRGCDNSSNTGGAMLSASGLSYLSADTLVFTASGEKPSALSVFSQGTAQLPSGVVFGMGVRCANTNLKRLYTKNAVGGVASAPTGSDPSVHARSAALGDTIAPGSSRYYYVYYRDPIVLGGCSTSSTFNSTQSGRVFWSW
jgi:Tol biopolymer transport system component